MLSWLEVSFPSFIPEPDRAGDRHGSPPEYLRPHSGPRSEKCRLVATLQTGEYIYCATLPPFVLCC